MKTPSKLEVWGAFFVLSSLRPIRSKEMNAAWKERLRRAKDRSTLVGQIARTITIDPRHGVDDALEHLQRRFERPAPAVDGLRSPVWEQRLHALLGMPWPCVCAAEFEPVWQDIRSRLDAAGLRTGRGAYDGWDDGDRALARAAWCATRHLRPRRVVETGVARGIVTRAILEALAGNAEGRLWSIDMPVLLHPELAPQVGIAVPADARERWTLISGTSRQRLRPLLAQLGSIDLFVHDSLHTERNIRFELDHAWQALRPAGVAIVDDIHFNGGFDAWHRQADDAGVVVCLPDDEQALFGLAVKHAAPVGHPVAAPRGRFTRPRRTASPAPPS